jgi:hypothetical protein
LSGLLTAVIGPGILGHKVSMGEAWRRARIGPVLRAAALLALAQLFVPVPVILVVIGLLLGHLGPAAVIVGVLGIPAVVVIELLFLIRLSLTIPAVVLERVGPWTGMKRSWQLSRGSFWRLFGITFLAAIIAEVCTLILQIPFSVANGAAGGFVTPKITVLSVIISAIGSIVAGSFVRPFIAGVPVLLYLDMRMRREGFDLALRNAAKGTLTGDEFATLWQPPSPGTGQWSTPAPWSPQDPPANPWQPPSYTA